MENQSPLIVIVGPTASGKTGLSIRLAKKHHGEVISADSKAIYKGLDIGTAKPTISERQGVPHWALDIADIGDTYTAADFQKYAADKIKDIQHRGRVPFLVGGTGLYIDSVLYGYEFGPKADLGVRKQLEELSVKELQDYCIKNNIELPLNTKNRRHLIRAIEQKGINRKRYDKIIDNAYVVGISTKKETLHERIKDRAFAMFKSGVVEESTNIETQFGMEMLESLGVVYREVAGLLKGDITKEEAINRFIASDKKLVKKQITWFKRNADIKWMSLEEAYEYIDDILANRPVS